MMMRTQQRSGDEVKQARPRTVCNSTNLKIREIEAERSAL